MTTIRVERRKKFTVIDRSTVNDDSLSFRARGLLVWLLDKPDGWRVNSTLIERAGKEGREAVRSALRELEDAGYLERTQAHDRKTGRWTTEAVIHESPPTASRQRGTDAGEPGANTNTDTDDCYPPTPQRRRKRKTCTSKREWRPYDEEPMSPEDIMNKYGVTP